MISKPIFFKKKSNNKVILIIFFLLFLILCIFFFILHKDKQFIIITENTKLFYVIPKDKGGEKVLNIDKESLNLKKNKIDIANIKIPEDLLYSIQYYVN